MKHGAPARNQNAGGSGLYSSAPTVRVALPQVLSAGVLAPLARDMADHAMWLAERLAEAPGDEQAASQAAALYAKVAHELYQLGGELLGGTGIKAAPLGKLKPDVFQDMLLNEQRAMELVLSQLATAMKRLQDRETIQGDGVVMNLGSEDDPDWQVNPVLSSMAGHMRAAGRMLRDLAANLAWRQISEGQRQGAAERLVELINKPTTGETR